MKFQPIVASLVLLGMVSPVLAHYHHHAYARKSKELVGQEVPDEKSVIDSIRSEGWLDYIRIGGMGSVIGIAGNRDLPGSFTQLGGGSDIFVNNANLLVGVDLSSWSKIDLNLSYLGAPNQWKMVTAGTTPTPSTPSRVENHKNHRLVFDEASVTLGNFDKYPVSVQFGKLYVPFGDFSDKYIPWEIESPAQMLSQTNALAAVIGVSYDFGLYGNLFAFKGESNPINSSTNNIRNWGAKVGYRNTLACMSAPNTNININAGYVRSVWDSMTFAPDDGDPGYSISNSTTGTYGRNPVGGLSLHADLSHDAFSIYADWVGALSDMNPAYQAAPAYSGSSNFWGANVNAAYAFNTLGHGSSFGAGLQLSGNGQWFATESLGKELSDGTGGLWSLVVPRWRALGEYKISLFKHTDLGLVFAHSKSYDFNSDARTSNVGLARLGVKF